MAEAGYLDLYDALLGQAGVEPRPVGTPRHRPRRRGEPLRFDTPSSLDEARAKSGNALAANTDAAAGCGDAAMRMIIRTILADAELEDAETAAQYW